MGLPKKLKCPRCGFKLPEDLYFAYTRKSWKAKLRKATVRHYIFQCPRCQHRWRTTATIEE